MSNAMTMAGKSMICTNPSEIALCPVVRSEPRLISPSDGLLRLMIPRYASYVSEKMTLGIYSAALVMMVPSAFW